MDFDRIGQLHFVRGLMHSEPEGGAGPIHTNRPTVHSLVASHSSAVASRVSAGRGEFEVDHFTTEVSRDSDWLVNDAEITTAAGECDVDVFAMVADRETLAHGAQVDHDMGGILVSILVVEAKFGGAAGVESDQWHEAHAIGLVVNGSHRFGELILEAVGEPEGSNQESAESEHEGQADHSLGPNSDLTLSDRSRCHPSDDRPDCHRCEDEDEYEVPFLMHDRFLFEELVNRGLDQIRGPDGYRAWAVVAERRRSGTEATSS